MTTLKFLQFLRVAAGKRFLVVLRGGHRGSLGSLSIVRDYERMILRVMLKCTSVIGYG